MLFETSTLLSSTVAVVAEEEISQKAVPTKTTRRSKTVRFDLDSTQRYSIPKVSEVDKVWYNKGEIINMMDQCNQDARKCSRASRQCLRRVHKESMSLSSCEETNQDETIIARLLSLRPKLCQAHMDNHKNAAVEGECLGLERTAANAMMDVGLRRVALETHLKTTTGATNDCAHGGALERMSLPSTAFAREVAEALAMALRPPTEEHQA